MTRFYDEEFCGSHEALLGLEVVDVVHDGTMSDLTYLMVGLSS